MNLDVRTALILTAICTVLMSLTLLLAARRSLPSHRSLRLWAAGGLCQSLGWILLGLRDATPELLSIVAGNGAVLLSLALFYSAIVAFLERLPSRAAFPVAGTGIILLACFTYAYPSTIVRVVIMSLWPGVLMLMAGLTLLRDGGTNRPASYWITGTGFTVSGAIALLRAIGAPILDPSMTDVLDPSGMQDVSFIGSYITIVIVSFSFMLMHNDKAQTALLRLATRDSLTDAYNRGMFEELARKEIARSRRAQIAMSLLVLDLDHFKSVNDTHGHAAGDRVLRTVVESVRRMVRAQDVVGRFGGEEFVVLLPNTHAEQAMLVAERLRVLIAGVTIDTGRESLRVTVSIGVAGLADDDYDALFQRADSALYRAKLTGRDRVVSQDCPAVLAAPLAAS